MVVPYFIGGATTAAAGSHSLDIRNDGVIIGVQGMSAPGTEISFASTAAPTVNDRQTVIAATNVGGQINISGLAIPVQAGERLFAHWEAAAGVGSHRFVIYVDETAASQRPSQRRR